MFLPKLKACWGGATIAPVAETTTAGSLRRQNDIVRPRRSTNNSKRTSNWKPKLRVISEDGVMGDIDRSSGTTGGGDRMARSSDRKSTVKSKAKSTTKVSEASRRADDYYRKCTRPTPIPAFSPAPFVI